MPSLPRPPIGTILLSSVRQAPSFSLLASGRTRTDTLAGNRTQTLATITLILG